MIDQLATYLQNLGRIRKGLPWYRYNNLSSKLVVMYIQTPIGILIGFWGAYVVIAGIRLYSDSWTLTSFLLQFAFFLIWVALVSQVEWAAVRYIEKKTGQPYP